MNHSKISVESILIQGLMMRNKLLTLIMIILVPVISESQSTHKNQQTQGGLSYYLNQPYQSIPIPNQISEIGSNDLIVGYPDPNEIKTISGDYTLNGNIYIVQNGILNLDQANFRLKGDIWIFHNGQMQINGGTFTIVQEYIYEHNAVVANQGGFSFLNTQFQSSRQSWGITLIDSTKLTIKGSEITDGFITTGLLGKSQATISNTMMPGEYLCMGDNNIIEFNHSDFLIMWFVLSDSSIVNASLPNDSLLTNFQFSNAVPGIEGVTYSIDIDSCTNVLWGLISNTGSEATFRDTDFRVIGMMFNSPDSIIVNHLTNGSTHTDETLDIPDRMLRLINSSVETWNFYTSAKSNLTVKHCIFGELLAMNNSKVIIDTSLCDGTGGYIGSTNQASLSIIASLTESQVISKDTSFIFSAQSSFLGSEIDADSLSNMLLFNTGTLVEPEAHRAANVFEIQIPPVEGYIGSEVPITGTARIISGPTSLIEFDRYKVEFSTENEPSIWHPTDGVHENPVSNSTIALWNTSGLESGNYNLKLTLYFKYATIEDSLPIHSYARLEFNTDILINETLSPTCYKLAQNFPNPFNANTSITFSIPSPGQTSLKIYNTLGREIRTLYDDYCIPGSYTLRLHTDEIPSGLYFYQLQSGAYTETRKLILLK